MEKKIIYLDHAATTATRPEVVDAMLPYFTENFWNPSSVYTPALNNRKVVDESRETIARSLGTTPENIYFTAGGSESDNWALKCTAEAYANKGKHIITSKIEHHAILHTAAYLEERGFEVTYLDVDENGVVDLDQLQKAITPETILISVMAANNEIGTIQPLEEIGSICHEKGVLFHTDAVQAIGHIPVNIEKCKIDMLSLSAHKFHGPKGAGVLYVRRGVVLKNIIEGGAQERGKRAGTENVAAIVGLAAALEDAASNLEKNGAYVTKLRNRLVEGLSGIERSRINGTLEQHLPGTLNMCFEGIEGESLLLLLDRAGIAASSGSACTSGSLDPSHVLLAIGVPVEIAHGSLRLSISEKNTMEEMEHIVKTVPEVVSYLRSISPVWEKIKKEEQEEA